jgi:hypothetical protein
MKRLILTEEEKTDILNKYNDADNKILVYLRRNFPSIEIPLEYQDTFGKYKILVDDKAFPVKGNFKNIVNRIDNFLIDEFPGVDDKIRRQTIKKYIKFFEL